MDQHPVPQDITGFQFKLVGDMTLKQFGYLAAGAVIAWVFYMTSWNPIVKMPLAFFSFTFGVALAFLPIQERPLETWIVNFFKSIYRPTQYIWKKSATKLDFLDETSLKQATEEPVATLHPNPANEEQLQAYLDTMQHATASEPDDKNKQEEVLTVDDLIAKKSAADNPPVTIDNLFHKREIDGYFVDSEMRKVKRDIKVETPNTPNIDDLTKIAGFAAPLPPDDNLSYAISTKQKKIDETEAVNRKLLLQIDELNQKISDLARQHQDKSDESRQYQEEMDNMKKIVDEFKIEREKLQDELKMAKKGVKPVDQAARVKFIDQIAIDKALDGKLPHNTIHGLVDDQNGAAISGVIVLIKNAQGSPVRALRTNKLGQFLASTPLENGTYYIELEKDGFTFDEVKLDLTGTTLSPIEIKAK